LKVIERVLDVTSNLEGEKIDMSIDQSALHFIMSVLTDLYSDPEMAIIREYSTNAFDAHIEDAVSRPIEVTTPSPLSPYFRVRDYGLGLDDDDIREVYSLYGASTKRGSDDVVGMLGLGCKSALTYTDQFTLSGIKDGLCTQVAISRDEDGSGSMTVVDQYPTDEPSGVEIVIPAKQGNRIEEKAKNFFRFWKPGTVLLDGKEPKLIQGMKISDDLLLTNEVDQSYVVMGNVPYPAPVLDEGRRWTEWPTVAFVEIGTVQFTPSRESLQMTALTKATLATVKERVKTEKEAAYLKLLDACATPQEALALSLNSGYIGVAVKAEYKGQEIPGSVSAPLREKFIVAPAVKRYRQKGWSTDRVIANNTWPKTIWLTDFDGEDFSAHKRKKLDQWASKNDLGSFEYYVLLKDAQIPSTVTEWIDPSMVYSWNDPKAEKIKVERNAQGTRVSGSYKAYVNGQYVYSLLAADIDTSKPIFYADRFFMAKNHGLIRNKYSEYTMVILGRNRINKFKRDFPSAKELHEACMELASKWVEKLTETQKLMLHLRTLSSTDKLKKFDESLVDDPDFKVAIAASKMKDAKLFEEYQRYGTLAQLTKVDWKNPLNKYPLLTNLPGYVIMNADMKSHTYLYVNAVYAAEQEAQNAV